MPADGNHDARDVTPLELVQAHELVRVDGDHERGGTIGADPRGEVVDDELGELRGCLCSARGGAKPIASAIPATEPSSR